ncbi:MAG: threonine--tRNA ligase [Thermoplasmata archaeon]|nr:threonine--tRNA ligase [Thermoplasmata archaeon]
MVSAEISVTYPDGRTVSTVVGPTAGELLRKWNPEGFGPVLAATWDGRPVDLSFVPASSGTLAPLTFRERAGRDILQHSAAHLVAKAIVERIPNALPTAGPPTEEGFYYDFDVRPLTPEDLDAVRAAMDRAVAEDLRFERVEVDRAEAARLAGSNPHKLGYLADIPPGSPVSFYRTGTFLDLCLGPHVPSTKWLAGVHILGFSAITAGGVKDGDPRQRIRGVGFPTKPELAEFLKLRAVAEARDHRTLGQKLELFSFSDEAPGFPFWHPNGMVIVRELERFVSEHYSEDGYREIRTPLMFAKSVFERSGHWEHYRQNMFLTEADGREFGWKPMNCPGAMMIFQSRARSYRELPLRLAEFAPLHRFEPSGTLHGLTRVREFVQDDAHLFVTEEQIEGELVRLLKWIDRAFTTFRLTWSYELSKRPAQFLGDPSEWDRAEAVLEKVLKGSGIEYTTSPGEGAFYAPKIDIHVRDSLGRPWQTGTIQLDYQMPARFGLEYQGADGRLHRPVVIHRTILGTWERFLGVLLEHCDGRLPPWLSPTQVRILPLAERHDAAADQLAGRLRTAHLRVDRAGSDETLSKRVRQAEIDRIPYLIVLGDQEVANATVALRVRGEKGQKTLSESDATARMVRAVEHRSFDP